MPGSGFRNGAATGVSGRVRADGLEELDELGAATTFADRSAAGLATPWA